ncbi:hypothetical protein GJV52_00075 [Neisseria brasiliensis]|uniref:Uncharacterized protein n=1 Tax=Neisseria brasiliensis TaxID=2666100 RepID=A0A5Q3RZ81_9NEIS|nr:MULTISPECIES: hypothetical protein [Neisseria]MRN37095.1 hypothetical protein [Neisseria brasiliensis]QGL24084.1 hypothetical protein GJV52_00075 [Neisseria brasiliensis]
MTHQPLNPYTQKIKAVEEALNRRPRKTLDYETPGDLFSAALANGI